MDGAIRFAHLIECDGPGGAERMLASLVGALQDAGHENVVILPAAGEGWLARELSSTGATLEYFRLDRPFSPAFARWLADLLRRHRIELAHSHEFTMAVYGAWAARKAGIPHLFTMHGGRYYAEQLRRRVALHLAARGSTAVVSVSHSLARHLARDLWISPARIVTVANGVRPPRIQNTEPPLREQLGLDLDDRLVVAVGNLYPVKGHTHLLEALALLAQRHPRLHVAIAGRGELEKALRERARELRVEKRFHLLGLRSDVGDVLAAADVFALPSLSEGVPLALLEAMLSGRPVVASAVGEVPTVLGEGGAGILVSPGNAEGLANALDALLADPEAARRLGAAARTRAMESYSFDAMLNRYLELYAEALGDHSHDGGAKRVRQGERQPLPHTRAPGKRALVR